MGDPEVSNEDTFRILLATDNHLGYYERDVIRGNDGIKTFEEILQIATQKKVDFILLGGDLFHENKPSRKCLHECFELLRKYCMGDRPIQFEFLSDQSINFKHNKFPIVNYEDPNLNVSIPVFSIHGNHDDPAGAGSFCALDLLSVAGLVNYFGKCTELNNIQISPLLMQKGATKLALYGLGSIRDERLHHLFKMGNISMLRPKEDAEDWFNVFVIHQNRAQHGATNYIPPNFLDDFLDLVFWGHEHECRLTPEYFEAANHEGFYISQPGSSIATSLSPGEVKQKHVGLLEVNKKSFKITNIPLVTVRPFYIENVTLSTSGLDFNSPEISKEVMTYCEEKVDALLEKAKSDRTDDRTPDKPLIRLRIEYRDASEMFNTQRFGQRYINKVANHKDIVLFQKKRTATAKKENDFDKEQLLNLLDTSCVDQTRVEDLVNEYFSSTEGELQLSLLSETGLSLSVKEFVDKEEPQSIDNLVNHQLGKVKQHLKPLEVSKDSIDDEIQTFREERKRNYEIEKKEVESFLSESSTSKKTSGNTDASGVSEPDTSTRGRGTRGRRGGARGGRGAKKSSGTDNDNDSDDSTPQSNKGGRGRGRGRGSRAGSSRAAPRGRSAQAGKTQNGKSNSKSVLFSDSENSNDDLFMSKKNNGTKNKKGLLSDSD